ncbi:hypothetical protein [Paraburkholderia bannensis]|uniref:hypothetical protein n=1 Tax=Paraburkholderia bannensis TaxID=765414 RepID=UPI002AB7626B|nr:hypothetical protein [Paraburkholderia bannensis]
MTWQRVRFPELPEYRCERLARIVPRIEGDFLATVFLPHSMADQHFRHLMEGIMLDGLEFATLLLARDSAKHIAGRDDLNSLVE